MTDSGTGLPAGKEAQRKVLIGACIGMFLNPSSLVLLPFGIYLLPIAQDTGWSREFVAGSISAAMLLIGLSPPIVGWLINRFGPRRVGMVGFPLCGLAMMLLGLPTSPGMFVAAMALFGILAACQTSILYITCLSGWYDRRRGTALGIGLASTGLAVATVPPLAAFLIGELGWRATYLTLGGIVFLVGIPVSRWLVLDPPIVVGMSRADIPGMTFRAAVRSRVFWLLAAAIFLVGAAASGGMLNLNLMLIERGVSAQKASFVLTLLGVTMIAARLICGALFDRMSGRVLTALICATVGAAFLVLVTRGDTIGVIIAAVLIGIGFGAEGDALSYMTSRAFGMREYGTIFGTVFLAFMAGGAAGPAVFAVTRARTGDDQAALWIAVGACAIATLLSLMIRQSDLPFVARGDEDAIAPDFAEAPAPLRG